MDVEPHSGKPRRRRPACGIALLLATAAFPSQAIASAAAQPAPIDQRPIIVTAPPLFRDVRPERTLNENGIASYGLSTIDELVTEIQSELGSDDEPIFLVNGERVYDLDEIGAYPVEALRQLQVLPRGAATRVGGSSSQRVISLTLRQQMRSATTLIAPRVSTAGHWGSRRGETIFTLIRGQTRGNLSFRVRDEDSILDSQRGVIEPPPPAPFSATGNVVSALLAGDEIDPRLSDLAGEVVTVAAIPATANPTLADFAAAANSPTTTDIGAFRTLWPESRDYDINGSFSTRIAPWLRSTATVRLDRTNSRSLLGLPSALFTLSPENPFSPFSEPVDLAFVRTDDPLRFRSTRDTAEASLTLNATVAPRWQASLNLRQSLTRDESRTDRETALSAIAVPDDVNPFAGGLASLIGVTTDDAFSRSENRSAQLTLTGTPFKLPAGDLHLTGEARLAQAKIRSHSSFFGGDGSLSVSRRERGLRGAIEVPIASRDAGFLPQLGELSATGEYARVHFSDAGSLERDSLALIWTPFDALRLRASRDHVSTPPSLELLGGPVVLTPDVRIFDVLTGETVDVVAVTGGNPGLLPQSNHETRLSAILRLIPRIGLELNSEYVDSDQRNFVSGLPAASTAIMAAFPDRFIRDATGTLIRVDLRPVNFARHQQRRLRFGLSLTAPLTGGGAVGLSGAGEEDTPDAPAAAAATPAHPPLRLQLTANDTILFKDTIVIRDGLDPVHLLTGGAIGLGGGSLRQQLDATVAVSSGGTGVRLSALWRGSSELQTRIDGAPSLLHFSPLLLANLRIFADLHRFVPHSDWTRSARVSLNVINLTNKRQRVRDSFGNTPLQFQPALRDPLGRTVEIELRKLF